MTHILACLAMKVVRNADGTSSVDQNEFAVMNPPKLIAEKIFASGSAEHYVDYVLTVFNLEEVDGHYVNPGAEYVNEFRRWMRQWQDQGYLICWGLKEYKE